MLRCRPSGIPFPTKLADTPCGLGLRDGVVYGEEKDDISCPDSKIESSLCNIVQSSRSEPKSQGDSYIDRTIRSVEALANDSSQQSQASNQTKYVALIEVPECHTQPSTGKGSPSCLQQEKVCSNILQSAVTLC